jgi:GAF domain-containing protein
VRCAAASGTCPFGQSEQTLGGTIADYASISLVNARLFRALAFNAEAAQAGEKLSSEVLQKLRQEVYSAMQTAAYPLEALLSEKMGALSPEQKHALESVQASLKNVVALVNGPGL